MCNHRWNVLQYSLPHAEQLWRRYCTIDSLGIGTSITYVGVTAAGEGYPHCTGAQGFG
jgi:hypothetical protein